ncbi:hypothetical protein KI688_010475 [Linnemannia hyalina]|uniref:Uncharacterized protein n=1 Tax=Linnemannia hyalina TaxID=64524 RepID=A0A9P7Y1G5_9FUNG|nr:hypothetical protein KI688_010475 [Linnemannia hyalina]
MENKFGSGYFKAYGKQTKPQARTKCNEYSSYPELGTFLGIYASIQEQGRRFFEQICEGQACNEYYDIDWKLNKVSNSDL